jgi:hypothetical protein
LVEKDPAAYLKEHIIRGDSGDGVPNFLSKDDCFVSPEGRQKPIAQKKLDVWLKQELEEFCTPEMLRGWKRNEQMVDLTKIPADIQTKILDSYTAQAGKGRDKLFNYFVENRLRNLLTDIDQF